MIAHGTPVGDDHSWVRPAGEDCPDCECCSAALCEVGAQLLDGCEARTSWDARALVRGCVCCSAATRGTVAHTLSVWHEHVEREEARSPGAQTRLHELFVARVLGSEAAKDPTLVGPKLLELIAELWPEPVAEGSC